MSPKFEKGRLRGYSTWRGWTEKGTTSRRGRSRVEVSFSRAFCSSRRVAKLHRTRQHQVSMNSMTVNRSRSASVISISSNDNPIVSKKTGRPIPTIDLVSSDDEASPPPKRPRLAIPEPAKSKDYERHACTPIGNVAKAKAHVSLGNEEERGKDDAETRLNALLRSWVDEGIAMAIRETSGPDSIELKK